MKAYREHLSAASWEASASLGGSFVSDSIDDYYLTPWDLGYGHLVRFDHDFLGRAALERLAGGQHRKKVWLRWDDDDAQRVITSSLFGKDGERAKYLDIPSSNYATLPCDSVLADGRLTGVAVYTGYTVNVGGWSSLAMVDEEAARDGERLTIVWGEPDGGTAKPTVERHSQHQPPGLAPRCTASCAARSMPSSGIPSAARPRTRPSRVSSRSMPVCRVTAGQRLGQHGGICPVAVMRPILQSPQRVTGFAGNRGARSAPSCRIWKREPATSSPLR
jgi:hypothetical protein